jgi:hypothetical protein
VVNYWSKHSRVKTDEKKVAPFAVYKEVADQWTNFETGDKYDDIFTPVWRWRRAFHNDFVCRMDWCTKPYKEANHHPVAAFNGDKSDTIVRLQATAGDVVAVDASATTDPDGDGVNISWWIYKEAGTYPGNVAITRPRQARTRVAIPPNAAGREIHVILEVKDKSTIASLYDYRRVVIEVANKP